MPYALMNSSGDKDYHSAIIRFLEDIEEEDVSGVVCVAITKSGPFLSWCASPIDIATAASVLQAQATEFYLNGGMCEDEDVD